MTDQEMLIQAEYQLLENNGSVDATGTFITDMYTTQQLLDALNNRQYQFLKDTALVQTRTTLPSVPQQGRYTLPNNTIEVRRVAWNASGGNIAALVRDDTWSPDDAQSDWEYTSGTPQAYQDATLPTREVELIPAPLTAGVIGILITQLATLLDGSGIALTVPDEFAPYVYYGALGDLLNHDGQGNDPQRGAYCLQRYEEGVALARVLMRSTGEDNG